MNLLSMRSPSWEDPHTHLLVPLGWVQAAPLSIGGAWMTYVSGFVPVPLLHAPSQGPVVTHVALQATGLHALLF